MEEKRLIQVKIDEKIAKEISEQEDSDSDDNPPPKPSKKYRRLQKNSELEKKKVTIKKQIVKKLKSKTLKLD